jgi:hypothetical protein
MMNRRIGVNSVLGAALFLSAGVARAQEPLPHPGGDVMIHQGGPGDSVAPPMGDRIELLGFEGMHGGKVVTGAPFSAVAISETSRTLADGNHIARKTQTNLFRDSQGRFRKEVTLPAIGPLATSGKPKSFVMINDPVAQQNFILHPDEKTAEKMGKPFGRMMGRPMRGGNKGGLKGNAATWEANAAASGNFKKEDLGTQTIAGVSAQGTRYTRIIPAGQIGNEKPITVVSEHWYSNDLQMTVMSKRSDPQFGETSYTLTNIQRAEPAASLFAVPSDYAVQEGRMGKRALKFQHAAPPAEN